MQTSPEDLKSRVGERAGPYREEATAERLTLFAHAVGARERGIAPPTFMTTCRRGEFDLFQKIGIDLARVLHAEQEYTYGEPIIAGDVLVFETAIVQVLGKSGSTGSLHFITLETTVESERAGAKVAVGKSRTTVVVR